ncbi:MAG: DUF1116 domain-containing protein [Nitriliruptorales bacterium]
MTGTSFHGLLDGPPAVVTAGIDLLEDGLAAQAVAVRHVDWRPPLGDTAEALARIAADPRLEAANAEALERITSAHPFWVDVTTAAEAVGLEPGEFLHAGPPIDWERTSGPLRGALIGAMLYEGLADDPDAAVALAEHGDVELTPCHHRSAVGPMAGVVSASMPMFVVKNETHGNETYCSLNEGLGKVLRYGAFAPDVIERLRWMESVLAPALRDTIRAHGPVDLRALVAQALQMGDEGHNRNRAGTSLLLREIVGDLVETGRPTSEIAEVVRFVNGNDHFVLNLVMPAAKASLDPARDLPGSSVIVAMARNGTDFGIQVSGTGDRWFTGPADVPVGLFFPGFSAADANPDIGDSTIMETAGVGGFAMAAAPAIVRFVGGAAGDALRATRSMYEITLAEHPTYQIPVLEFRGTPVGVDVTRVVRSGVLPFVNTGIAGREAGTGQVGAGLVSPPEEVFVAAVRALAEATTLSDPSPTRSRVNDDPDAGARA